MTALLADLKAAFAALAAALRRVVAAVVNLGRVIEAWVRRHRSARRARLRVLHTVYRRGWKPT